jgi:hypothetical protein
MQTGASPMNLDRYMPKLHWHHHPAHLRVSEHAACAGSVQSYTNVFLHHVDRPHAKHASSQTTVKEACLFDNVSAHEEKYVNDLLDVNYSLRASVQQAIEVHHALSQLVIQKYHDDPQFVHKTITELCVDKLGTVT